MTVRQDKGATANSFAVTECPLCGQDNILVTRQFGSERIARYWRDLGYDVESDFPELRQGLSKCQCIDCNLRFFVPSAVGGPELYAALGRRSAYYAAAKWEYADVLRHLSARQRGGSLLEVGCGPGHFLEHARRYFQHATGVDFNEAAVREARARGLDVHSAGLDTLTGPFDVIAAFQVIEHVPNPREALGQLVRLLRPGGELIIAVPNEDSLLGTLEWNCLNLPPHHVTCWTKAAFEFVARLFSLDLEVFSREPLGLDLYLAALYERLDRYLSGRNLLMRLGLWPIRRAALGYALVRFDQHGRGEYGHTHIAFFRKPKNAGA